MREPKTLLEKVWERHVVQRAEVERAAHLRRACGGDTRRKSLAANRGLFLVSIQLIIDAGPGKG